MKKKYKTNSVFWLYHDFVISAPSIHLFCILHILVKLIKIVIINFIAEYLEFCFIIDFIEIVKAPGNPGD